MDDNLSRKSPARDRARARSHREEREARLEAVESWLAQRLSRAEIVNQSVKRWRVSTRQADRYIQDAAGRWRQHVEPHRDENRRRNLATVDYGIAEACRLGKLRDLAVLVRLRARLDGSLDAPLLGPPQESAPGEEQSAETTLSMTCDMAIALADVVPMTPEVRQRLDRLIRALELRVKAPTGSEGQSCG